MNETANPSSSVTAVPDERPLGGVGSAQAGSTRRPPSMPRRPPQSGQSSPAPSVMAAAVTAAVPDPASPSSVLDLRLTQNFHEVAAGRPVRTHIPVEKPPKSSFFRISTDESHCISLCILDSSRLGGSGVYAVAAEVAALINDQVRNVKLHMAVTPQGALYFVPVPLPGPDGRTNPWHISLARAVEMAKTSWIRLSANQPAGSYDVFEAIGQLPEPKWPGGESFEELLEIAFRDRLITSADHPLVQQLLGAA